MAEIRDDETAARWFMLIRVRAVVVGSDIGVFPSGMPRVDKANLEGAWLILEL